MDTRDEGNAMARAQTIADTLEEALGEPVSFNELYARGELLGQGSTTDVYEATDRMTGQRVAARFRRISHPYPRDPRDTHLAMIHDEIRAYQRIPADCNEIE
ncbi:hypothetical protein KIPB_011854, partial [Kipferlia bialata]|eukprot:g11854.t1